MSADTATPRRVAAVLADLPGWASSLLTGAALVALLDLFRVVMPSLSFVYAVIGSDEAGDFTGFAVAMFLAAALLARAAGINARLGVPLTGIAVIAARLAIVTTEGGDPQLLISSLGFVVAVGLLGAIAGSDINPRHAARGLALGFVYHATANAILRWQDSLWYGGAIAWLLAVVVVIGLVIGWRGTMPEFTRPEVRTATPWLLLGPVIAVQGVVASTPAGPRAAWGEGAAWTGALLVAVHGLGYVAGRAMASTFLRESMGVVTLSLATLTAASVLGSGVALAAVSTLLVAFLAPFALVLGGESKDDVLASSGRRSGSVAGGTILLLMIGLGYYVGYQSDLGFPQALVPASACVLIGLVMFRQEPRPDQQAQMTMEDVATIGFAPFVALFVLMASTLTVPAARSAASLEDLRVMTYNVRMGFGVGGEFEVEQMAAVIRSQRPDIVVLNEVDRGWMLTGGHDTLELLGNSLQMEYVFAPAADAIWGNAILSRLPMSDVTVTQLPLEAPAVMERSVVTATVNLGGGQEIGVIATHLSAFAEESGSRLVQAQVLAELVFEYELAGTPVMVIGDLNAEFDDSELAPLSGLVNAPVVAAGGPVATYPSDNPTTHIDHILVSPGFTATDLSIPSSDASDHLGVAVTLRWEQSDG